jgi:hypothetical protein
MLNWREIADRPQRNFDHGSKRSRGELFILDILSESPRHVSPQLAASLSSFHDPS